MPSASQETLVAYLRKHGESHSPEALRKSLLRQGYDATAVDEACRIYVAETPNPYQDVSGVGWTLRIFSLVVLALLALAGVGVLLVGACTAGYGRIMTGAMDHQFTRNMELALALYLGLLVVFAGLVTAVWYATRAGRPGKKRVEERTLGATDA
jgi:hypothetical protein